ncbi:MAG: sigma-54-dependent Fis family transcriptional regulator [Candidatus Eisenbacteria bacterium]|uniref:Sigma-54-dependent Fis family transcriptional regulator n=1 Tax=Eiseniibacteriota bacterium TaxID=2212470 RepID=A0A9D6LBH0_UNCEI|nr:sigma-54-dependent Fis family transcriptional regulator [Candidatus Eisenbacteria bacterium]MBI3540093.1 sigma-54-dependent Fis family transcriptional regulator [Candidatus Eisenbacteria bacterium]
MRVLVVDDEIKNAELTALELRDAGHETEFVNASRAALKRLEGETFDAVVTDLRMAPPDGLALLTEIRTRWPATAVVLMTAYSTKETARRALNDGAAGYVDKEGEFRAELRAILERIARERRLEADNRTLSGTVDSLRKGLATVIGESPAIRQSVALAEKVAATDSTVLLRGESGTGKDLFARAIHFSSRRAAGPWVKVNCGALPEALLESELFGHEKGAFTGAVRQKPGRFEDAADGTLFLDEIGELPMSLQVKLLQVIEEKTFTHVGGNQPITVDVRIIAATNRDLEEMVKARQFREDLFFRLNVFPIRLPSLRERPGDIPALVGFFLGARGARRDQVSAEAMRALEQYAFPGNVRELEHTLERATILAGSDPIGTEHLSFARPEMLASFAGASGPAWVPAIPPEGLSLEVLERELILKALDMARGNKSQAARLLGLTRRTLYSRMEKHGLRKPGEGEASEGDDDAGEGDDVASRRAGA